MKEKRKKVNRKIKREFGQFFTITNPFEIIPFVNWFEKIKDNNSLVEPFAGSKLIVSHIEDIFGKKEWKLYDILPQADDIIEKDTILNMPDGHIAITNPPYLGKSSAKRRNLFWYPENKYDDLYKFALSEMLKYFKYVAAIIPESFITSRDLKDRLEIVISLTTIMFEDTDCPVCLALFSPEATSDYEIWSMNSFIGFNSELERYKIQSKNNTRMKFNDPEGRIGVRAIDSLNPDIMFVLGDNIDPNKIKHSSRSLTRISVDSNIDSVSIIERANKILHEYRSNTQDVFMTSFKGLRKDGRYRRRIDFKTIRLIINKAIEEISNE